MKRYLMNLWQALRGHDPYKATCEKLGTRLVMAAADIGALRSQYYGALEMLEKKDKQIVSYQNLTENLRSRITDKDIFMEGMKKGYQERVEQYTREIDRLRQTSAPREKSAT